MLDPLFTFQALAMAVAIIMLIAALSWFHSY
jgi:hypothetical protein